MRDSAYAVIRVYSYQADIISSVHQTIVNETKGFKLALYTYKHTGFQNR